MTQIKRFVENLFHYKIMKILSAIYQILLVVRFLREQSFSNPKKNMFHLLSTKRKHHKVWDGQLLSALIFAMFDKLQPRKVSLSSQIYYSIKLLERIMFSYHYHQDNFKLLKTEPLFVTTSIWYENHFATEWLLFQSLLPYSLHDVKPT